ncbi:MAG: hypothetical protein RLN60_00625 [Phycisphaerales bacterium]
MSDNAAQLVVTIVAVYAGVGLVVALLFLFLAVKRIDPAANGASRGFRVLVFPGAAALWPVILVKWIRGGPNGGSR